MDEALPITAKIEFPSVFLPHFIYFSTETTRLVTGQNYIQPAERHRKEGLELQVGANDPPEPLLL